MKRGALAATLALTATTVMAPAQAADPDSRLATVQRPLVYVIVLDGLDGDLYDAGRLPFLKGLVSTRGTYYRESRAIMLAETNPNHTAMITGAYGDTSGIPANDFALYGSGDGCPMASARGPSKAGLAPACVTAQTFFQSTALKGVRDRITTAGIFGKPKLATLFSAKRSRTKYAADHLWTPCVGTRADYCRKVPLNPMGYADDDVTMDALLASVRKGVKAEDGTRRTPNLAFVNLPTIDTTGHLNGTGKRYRQAASAADEQLRRFVRQQKKLGFWKRTVMMVLSDHSMATTQRTLSLSRLLTDAGIPADAYTIAPNGGTDLVYLRDRTSPDRFALLQRMRAAALGAPGVDEALYRESNPVDGDAVHTLDLVHPEWHLASPRIGDLVVVQTGGAFAEPSSMATGGHGAPDTLNTLFTVTGGWQGIAKNGTVAGQQEVPFDGSRRNPSQPQSVDVAPTALWLLGLQPPRDNQGRVLSEAFRRG